MTTRGPDMLRDVGEALYGPHWQSVLARELDVADRTMRRWISGDSAIPDGLWTDLAAICSKRGIVMRDWAKRLTSPA